MTSHTQPFGKAAFTGRIPPLLLRRINACEAVATKLGLRKHPNPFRLRSEHIVSQSFPRAVGLFPGTVCGFQPFRTTKFVDPPLRRESAHMH